MPDRETPELQRLQAGLGARHAFRDAARIIETFLPRAKQWNTTVRNRLGRIAADIAHPDRSKSAIGRTVSSPPPTVLIDGSHVRCRPEFQKRHLDVVVGKTESPEMCRRFGLAPHATMSPAKQIRRDPIDLGWNGRKTVTVISDGEPALPDLIRAAVGGPG